MLQKFPKIGKLTDAAGACGKSVSLPFRGTVKAHGTHADLVLSDTLTFQSRNRIITGDADIFGFIAWMKARPYMDLFKFPELEGRHVMISGEFCGAGIQRDVGVADLPFFFYVFAIRVDGVWVDMEAFSHVHLPAHRIYNSRSFKTYDTDVNFNALAHELSRLQEMADQVQICCPLADGLGGRGEGEGIVWTCTTLPWLTFKVKGFKFALCDERLAEIMRTKRERKEGQPPKACAVDFAKAVLTPARLRQGLQEASGPDMGAFLKWLADDVLQEEEAFRLEMGLEEKAVRKAVGSVAVPWFNSNKCEVQ